MTPSNPNDSVAMPCDGPPCTRHIHLTTIDPFRGKDWSDSLGLNQFRKPGRWVPDEEWDAMVQALGAVALERDSAVEELAALATEANAALCEEAAAAIFAAYTYNPTMQGIAGLKLEKLAAQLRAAAP